MTLLSVVRIALCLGLTYFFARTWFASAWSEAAWTWLNARIRRGQDPSFVSDLELIVVVATSVLLAWLCV